MSENAYKTISDGLDGFIQQIVKISALIPEPGLMNGKTGIAILLYHYAQYKNNPKIREYADNLMDMTVQEINMHTGKDFDKGLCGIAWGVDYLMKQGFVQANEDIFEEIDAAILQDEARVFDLYDLGLESETGLYVENRLQSCEPVSRYIWQLLLTKLVLNLRDILRLRYTHYNLPVFPCRSLIRFFYITQILLKRNQCIPEIEALYDELSEIVKISYQEEKSVSDQYILSLLLADIPKFEKCIPFNHIHEKATLTDVSNFYLTQLVLDVQFPIPEIFTQTLLSIAEDKNRMNELLYLLNPNNAGLGNYVGGLAWAMLQWCMEHDKLEKV